MRRRQGGQAFDASRVAVRPAVDDACPPGDDERPHRGVVGRCCMNTRCGWGGVARTSRDPPQESHYRDEVEGPSHV